MRGKTLFMMAVAVILISCDIWVYSQSRQHYIAAPVYDKKDLLGIDTFIVSNKKNVVHVLKDGYWVCNETGVEFMSPKFYEKWRRKNNVPKVYHFKK